MTPRTWYLAATGVVLLIAAAAVGLVVQGDDTPPSRAAAGTATHTAAPTSVSTAAASSATSAPRTTATTARSSATPHPTPVRTQPTHRTHPTHRTPPPSPQPTTPPHLAANTFSIPNQHVVAPIDQCRIVAGGLEPPADIRRTCYWAGGAPLSARAGTTVVVGQCNWAGRLGALGRLGRLRAGDRVVTAGMTARVTEWRVVAVTYRPKELGILPAAFVGHAGPRQLYLITGGGRFDAASQSYVDNIYVQARPIGR